MAAHRQPRIAYTFDLHAVDLPDDIVRAAQGFREAGRVATFFVPSAMLGEPRYAGALQSLPRLGHEVASHGHLHDWHEIGALMRGTPKELRFLRESWERHAQFFGTPPTSFRSPHWCTLGRSAIEELQALGYTADSSATPQRLPIFSSQPFHPGWWSSPRRVHALASGLLEIPTSTLLLPAGAPTFLTLRSFGTSLLLALLTWEAGRDPERPIVLQFHVEDFVVDSRRERGWGRPSWRDFVLHRTGGLHFKVFLRDTDPDRIVAMHNEIVDRFSKERCATITSIAHEALVRASALRDAAGAGTARAGGVAHRNATGAPVSRTGTPY